MLRSSENRWADTACASRRSATACSTNACDRSNRHGRCSTGPSYDYSAGLISRIEKGHANPPLHAYIHIAEALDTEPGRLLGPHDLEAEFSADERALILFLRRTELPIDEALARLVRPAPPGTS